MNAILRLIHIGDAVVWAGGAIFMAMFVTPAATAAGPAAGPFMSALALRTKLTEIMTAASLLTVASGLWLWFRRYGTTAPTGYRGVAISIGAIAGISALWVGATRQRQTIMSMRSLLTEIGASPPNEDQAGRLMVVRNQMTGIGNVLAVLVSIAIAGMAIGA